MAMESDNNDTLNEFDNNDWHEKSKWHNGSVM